jgi:glutamate-1-semialdehyde aminotransferase
VPIRPKAERISDALRNAARLHGEAVEMRELARMMSLHADRDRCMQMAATLDAAADNMERIAREMQQEGV